MDTNEKHLPEVFSLDERRELIIPGDASKTIDYAVNNFLTLAQKSISHRGKFAVALSGGSTPKAIYEGLARQPYCTKIDWSKVWLFWSDERAVPPGHQDSNYRMAMEAGLASLNIPTNQIVRMEAEGDIQEGALEYEKIIQKQLNGVFDLVMLGIGDDGHTASLFPKTHGLHPNQRLVIANFIPDLNWRMTLTFFCINQARHIQFYVIGRKKAEVLNKILNGSYDPDLLPAQGVGVPTSKALYIIDREAASEIS